MSHIWTHITFRLSGYNSTTAYLERDMIHVDVGATLLRTIVNVNSQDSDVFAATEFPPQFPPLYWAVGDVNSDVTPHMDVDDLMTGLELKSVLAWGAVPFHWAQSVHNATATGHANADVPISGHDYTETYHSTGWYHTWASDHVDSQAQRLFPFDTPRINASIRGLTPVSPFNENGYPATDISVRQLWKVF